MPEDDFVTLKIIQTMLEMQATAYKESFKMMFEGLREELKDVKKDISDLKESLSFSQGQLDTNIKKVEEIDVRTSFFEPSLNAMSDNLESIEDNLEYQENMSRRNNVKLVGFPESDESESWDQSEEILKSQVKDVLGIEEELDIELLTELGKRKNFSHAEMGQRYRLILDQSLQSSKVGNKEKKSSKLQNRFALLMSNFWKTLVKEHWIKELKSVRVRGC